MKIGSSTKDHNAKYKAVPFDFIKESNMNKDLRYVKPTYFTTTRWGAYQFGWLAKCGTSEDIWCIYGAREDRQGHCYKVCRHPDKSALIVFADVTGMSNVPSHGPMLSHAHILSGFIRVCIRVRINIERRL
jgi:hypothetical protein